MIEKKGSQYRIRVISPNKFNKNTLRTKDVGEKGGLKLIIGRLKGKRTTTIQDLRVSIKDFQLKNNKLIPKTIRGMSELKSMGVMKYGRRTSR